MTLLNARARAAATPQVSPGQSLEEQGECNMKTGEACTWDVVCIDAGASITQAARTMRERHVGDLVITRGHGQDLEPTGIVTDRDLVLEVLAEELDIDAVSIGDLFCSDTLAMARGDDEIEDTVDRMRDQGVRRMPVVDDAGRLMGIISLDDLLQQVSDQLAGLVDLIQRQPRLEARRRVP